MVTLTEDTKETIAETHAALDRWVKENELSMYDQSILDLRSIIDRCCDLFVDEINDLEDIIEEGSEKLDDFTRELDDMEEMVDDLEKELEDTKKKLNAALEGCHEKK